MKNKDNCLDWNSLIYFSYVHLKSSIIDIKKQCKNKDEIFSLKQQLYLVWERLRYIYYMILIYSLYGRMGRSPPPPNFLNDVHASYIYRTSLQKNWNITFSCSCVCQLIYYNIRWITTFSKLNWNQKHFKRHSFSLKSHYFLFV